MEINSYVLNTWNKGLENLRNKEEKPQGICIRSLTNRVQQADAIPII